jgi:hypothetical protein
MKSFSLLFLNLLSFSFYCQYQYVTTYSGITQSGYEDLGLLNSKYNFPYGITYDGNNAFYIADMYNHAIRKIDIVSGQVSTLAGSGVAGFYDQIGTDAQFNSPSGVFYKNGFVYVADNLNNAIRKVDVITRKVSTVAGNGLPGQTNGLPHIAQFYQPKSLVVDDLETIYVADYENHAIRKIENGIVSTFAGEVGVPGNNDGSLATAHFWRPRDLTFDVYGNLYVTDLMNNQIKKIANGYVSTFCGTSVAGTVDGNSTIASFNRPTGIEHFKGNIYVIDGIGNKIRKISLDGTVETIAGNGISGYQDTTCLNAKFDMPQDLTLDANGNIYISDRNNNTIRVLNNFEITVPKLDNFENAFNLFPNPTNTILNIEFNQILKSSKYELKLKNILGENIYAAFIFNTNFSFDVSEFSKGIYFIEVIDENQKVFTKKIILH